MAVVYTSLSALTRNVAQLPALVHTAGLRGIRVGARMSVPLMRRRTREARPAWDPALVGAVASRDYLDAWEADALPDGAVLFNAMEHARVVELGQAPGTLVPTANLVRWLAARFGEDPTDAGTWRKARAIRLAIYRRGLLPRGVMTEGVEEVAYRVEQVVVKSLQDMLRKL